MAGIKDAEVRIKVLKIKEGELSLENIVTICRTEENSIRNEQKLSSKAVNQLKREPNQFQRGRSKSRQGRPTQRYGRANNNERSGWTKGEDGSKTRDVLIVVDHKHRTCFEIDIRPFL